MTEKLFYEDSHLQQFTAIVQDCVKTNEGYQIVLDKTAFFPEGGGQYADTGWLYVEAVPGEDHMDGGGVPKTETELVQILDVRETDGIIYHKADRPLAVGSVVHGQIEWSERFMKMQQHTGEHIVSGLVHAAFGYDNVGFHLGNTDCTMDFNGAVSAEELQKIELLANEAVVKNLDVEVLYPSKEELAQMEYRSKIEIEGQVRIVTIAGYDTCACCAPHVKKTGEIGLIRLTDAARYKGGVRVTMLCGFRALADYRQKSASVRQISNLLCAKEDVVSEAVLHLKEECAGLKQKLTDSKQKLLEYKVKELDAGQEVVCLFEDGLEGEEPRILMNFVLKNGHKMCAVFWKSEKNGQETENPASAEVYRYCIGSTSYDVRELGKALNTQFAGRGGGKPEMVQGSVKGNEEQLREWIIRESEELPK